MFIPINVSNMKDWIQIFICLKNALEKCKIWRNHVNMLNFLFGSWNLLGICCLSEIVLPCNPSFSTSRLCVWKMSDPHPASVVHTPPSPLISPDIVSLCSTGHPRTLDQAVSNSRDPPVSATLVLGLNGCATTAQHSFFSRFVYLISVSTLQLSSGTH